MEASNGIVSYCDPLTLKSYEEQKTHDWPERGKHIISHYNENFIIVYQAYSSTIANPAALHQDFTTQNPSFQPLRMTWIKPNFLWMMYRSGWATKPNQEHILAVYLRREWFESILSQAVLTNQTAKKCKSSNVVVQWDPDHRPNGSKTTRRAIQIGLRKEASQAYAQGIYGPAILKIEDITDYVREVRNATQEGKTGIDFLMKIEKEYEVSAELRLSLGMDIDD
ncbi:unnamed protein product [Blepharisma stoltei]|uniref:DUF4291 domain-containing protein n=1 Tax=Blepharisma stoltei TaxID=1481888 RepID=A0AAU9IK30_9CILI|nr:unnamed protein product [Blepharisma stoltei]